jgi:hypothetical protein
LIGGGAAFREWSSGTLRSWTAAEGGSFAAGKRLPQSPFEYSFFDAEPQRRRENAEPYLHSPLFSSANLCVSAVKLALLKRPLSHLQSFWHSLVKRG